MAAYGVSEAHGKSGKCYRGISLTLTYANLPYLPLHLQSRLTPVCACKFLNEGSESWVKTSVLGLYIMCYLLNAGVNP